MGLNTTDVSYGKRCELQEDPGSTLRDAVRSLQKSIHPPIYSILHDILHDYPEVGCVRLRFGFVSSSSYCAGGGLVCVSVGKADMLSAHFDGKQSRDPVDLPSTCHPSPSVTTFEFRSREVKPLLLDLNYYGGTDPLGMFPLFFLKGQLRFWPLVSLWYFCGFFGWVAFPFPGEWLMSPQFQRVHLPPQHPIIDQFP